MKILLAAPSSRKFLKDEMNKSKYYLESFYTMPNWLIPILKQSEMYMVDSGAFTFMNGRKNVDFDKYLSDYINFINENDVKYFFELDVDGIVGIQEVERMRSRLESETGKSSIPVWHKSRGKDYFIKMCKKYNYVAIGGIVTREIPPSDYKYFTWFIDTAHFYGCKIHGLGFTNLKGLFEYPFDSVDSTSWTAGGKFGTLYHFTGDGIVQVDTSGRRRRTDISTDPINRHNFYEWVKFQQYADIKL